MVKLKIFLTIFTTIIVSLTVIASNSFASGPPEISGPQIKYRVTGASKVIFLISVKFKNSYYDYSYEDDIGNELKGYLPLPLSPEDVQIEYIAISEKGTKSKPLTTSNSWTGIPFILFTQLVPYHFKIEN